MSAAPQTATYVFCLMQAERRPPLRGAPATLPGAGAPRLIAVDRDIWAVVADVPLDRFSSARLQEEFQDVEAISRHALAHASVVEFCFRRATVIPLKLFTLFSTDDRARAHLQTRGARLRKLFAKLRGLEEWGVRVIAGTGEQESAGTLSSGRDYLVVKKRLNDRSGTPPRATVKEANDAVKALGRLAVQARKETFPTPSRGRPFVTGASMLVPAKRRGQWKKEVARLGAALAKRGHRLDVTGPWPPYHFVAK